MRDGGRRARALFSQMTSIAKRVPIQPRWNRGRRCHLERFLDDCGCLEVAFWLNIVNIFQDGIAADWFIR